jgi:hypothetical protein
MTMEQVLTKPRAETGANDNLLLEVSGLRKGYGKKQALNDVTLNGQNEWGKPNHAVRIPVR